MVDQQLLAYIREQISKGTAKDEIKKVLIRTGWFVGDIDAGFAEFERYVPSPLPPEAHPIVPSETKSFSVPTEQHVSRIFIVSRRFLGIALISLVALIVLIGGVYAYMRNIGPFAHPPYTEKNLFSGLLQAISRIDTSSYKLSASIAVGKRDVGAEPFTTRLPKNNNFRKQYQNDYKRAQDIQFILLNLREYIYPVYSGSLFQQTPKGIIKQVSSRPFPATLQQLLSNNSKAPYYGGHVSFNDPASGQQYEYEVMENGNNFKLIVTFETENAISALKRSYKFIATSTPIEGMRVIFTKDSSTYFYLSQEPRKPTLVQLGEYLGFLPAEMSGSITLGAQTDWRKTDADWKFNVNASGDFGDLTYKFDADALRKDSTYYFKINNIPGPFLASLSAIKGQWVKVDPSVASSSAGNFDYFSRLAYELPSAEKSYKERRVELTLLLKKMVSIADEEHLIISKSPPYSEKVDGRMLYRYDITIRKDTIVPFYKRLRTEVEAMKIKYDYPLLNDEGFITYLQSSEFNEIFDYYNKNTSLALWTDTQGFPSAVAYSLRVVPPDTAIQLKDKQVNMVFKLMLSDINKPVNIQVPSPVKSIEEFIKLSTKGEPYMRSRDARRVSDIKQIQLALELYFDANGNYPVGISYLAPKFIPTVPTDPSDKSSYHYTFHTSSKGTRDFYHIGASLEQDGNSALSNDRDCNSISNIECSASSGSWNNAGAFNGGDTQGCGSETGRYCYDVTP